MLWLFKAAGEKNSKNTNYQFWQQNNHPIVLESNRFKEEKLYYLHQNPVTAGLVAEPQHYIYSSAIDYAGGKGLISVTFYSCQEVRDFPIPSKVCSLLRKTTNSWDYKQLGKPEEFCSGKN